MVRLLCELNDGVEGKADTSDVAEILEKNPGYFGNFSLVIAHNLQATLLDKLAALLWSDPTYPILAVVNSAGFLAEFSLQFHEHTSEFQSASI